jgi:hypothetical protein
MLNRADLESIHKYSNHHRELMERSERAGCFYCEQFFTPGDVTEWIDGRQVETGSTNDGVTALCPLCGIDAVLPSAAPIPLTADVLAEMRSHWFDKQAGLP